jgi:hypothetical protein
MQRLFFMLLVNELAFIYDDVKDNFLERERPARRLLL